MHFKLILAFVEDDVTQAVLKAARDAGATGSTVISQARGEGVEKTKTFFGLTLETQRDVILLLVEEHMARSILETIAKAVGKRKLMLPAPAVGVQAAAASVTPANREATSGVTMYSRPSSFR